VIEVQIGGMTCASCAARVERTLNRIPGVVADVNFATDAARVHAGPQVADATVIAAIEQAGYSARLAALAIEPPGPGPDLDEPGAPAGT